MHRLVLELVTVERRSTWLASLEHRTLDISYNYDLLHIDIKLYISFNIIF